jgi:hypothetical protein
VVKTKLYISLLFLAACIGSIGCNPGIIDVPPPAVTDASAYFFPAASLPITFQDSSSSTGGKFVPITLSFFDSSGSHTIKQASGTVPIDNLTYTVGTDAVTLSGLSAHSIIPLAAGFTEKKQSVIAVDSFVIPVRHVLVTPSNSVIATSDSAGLYYSSDGNSWTHIQVNFGSKDNPVTALGANARGVFAGTSNGSVFMSTDGGNTWGSNPIMPVLHDSIFAFATETYNRYSPSLYISCNDTVYHTDSPGSILPKPVFASNLGNRFSSLTLFTGNGVDTLLIGGTSGNGLWQMANGKGWARVSGLPTTAFVNSVVATTTGLYCSTTTAIYQSVNGTMWTAVTGSIPSAILAFDGASTIAVNPAGSAIILRDSFSSASPLPTFPQKSLHDITALSPKCYAATDSGIYVDTTNNKQFGWHRIFSATGSSHYVSKELPGEMILLRSRTGSISLDSSWQADTLLYSTQTIPITGRIVGHFDQITMPDSTKYTDVIEVRYGSEVANQLSAYIPYWDMYFARNKGPIIIYQISGSAKTTKIYRSKN